jgi:phage shock protein PspC (stress-responsive transcriptional regulator)
MTRNDIDDTVRDMWSTRPHRRKDDRKIAGVAAAIGRRYGIDPVLVRVAFVVTTIFSGIGIALYLLGWLLLPAAGDEVSGAEALFGNGRSSMSKPLTILLAIALIPATLGPFDSPFHALLGLAGVAAVVFLLHKSRGGAQPGVGGPSMPGTFDTAASTTANAAGGTTVDTAAGTTAATAGAAAPTPTSDDTTGRTTPPAWDPLGAAPFAWDLPEPTPAEPAEPQQRAKRRRSAVTPVTIALALMMGGAAAIVAMTTSGVGAVEVAAVTLAVIGAGLVVGSLVRGGRGLIAVAIPLGLITYAMAVMPASHFGPRHGFGDRTWQAHTAAEVQPTYQLRAGDATLDLRELALPDSANVPTTVHLGLGELTVLLPANADVTVHCEASVVGEVQCLDGSGEGPKAVVDRTDYGADGQGKGGTIVLNASVGTGQITVSR